MEEKAKKTIKSEWHVAARGRTPLKCRMVGKDERTIVKGQSDRPTDRPTDPHNTLSEIR